MYYITESIHLASERELLLIPILTDGETEAAERFNHLLKVTGWSVHGDRVHGTFHHPRGSELRLGGQTAKMKIQAPQWTRGAIFL